MNEVVEHPALEAGERGWPIPGLRGWKARVRGGNGLVFAQVYRVTTEAEKVRPACIGYGPNATAAIHEALEQAQDLGYIRRVPSLEQLAVAA